MENNISKEKLQKIEEEAQDHHRIDLSRCSLNVLPKLAQLNKINLKNITALDVSENNLVKIPWRELSELVQLSKLEITNNNISELNVPDDVIFPNLTLLNVDFNPITELPENLGKFPNLKEISCYQCQLRSIPTVLWDNLPNLEMTVNENYLQTHDIPLHIFKKLLGIHDQHVPTEILPNFLYLGSVTSANNWDELQKLKIENIVCMTYMYVLPFEGKVKYHRTHIEDIETANIIPHFEEINLFLNNVKLANQRVLVHCAAGVSRSACAVLAYLMACEKMTLNDAQNFTTGRRPCIRPNKGFQAQLLEYEKILQQTLSNI